MKFNYSATDKYNKRVLGEVEASDRNQAVEALVKQGLKPLSLKEGELKQSKAGGFNLNVLGGNRVKLKDLVIFTRQMSTMISAGVPLVRSLQTMSEQTDNKYFEEVIRDLTKSVEGGTPLSESMAKYPNIFSDIYVNMVKAGESAGILDDVLKRLALQVEKDASIRKKIKSASAYPMVLLGVTVIAFFVIMLIVMPKLAQIITDLSDGKGSLPPLTVGMIAISNFMKKFYILIFIFLGGAGFGFKKYISTAKGKRQWHGLLLRTPIINTFVLKVSVARFSRIFASLMTAGVGVLNSIQITSGALGNVIIAEELTSAAVEVQNGKQLSAVLAKSEHFPKIVSQMLAVGEETGQIDSVLIKVADFYEEEVDTMIDGLAAIIEPLMIVILGAMVGLIAASVMGPISSLSQNIGTE